MAISFEEFSKQIPEETLSFVIDLLDALSHAWFDLYDNLTINSMDTSSFSKVGKVFFISLDRIVNSAQCRGYLDKLGYKSDFVDDKVAKSSRFKRTKRDLHDYDNLFETYSKYFLPNDSNHNYMELTPIDIFIPIMEAFSKRIKRLGLFSRKEANIFKNAFNPEMNFEEFKDMIIRLRGKIKETESKRKLDELFKEVPENVQLYLKMAYDIRKDIVNDPRDKKLINSEEEFTLASLLLALGFYESKVLNQFDINIDTALIDFLEQNGLHVRATSSDRIIDCVSVDTSVNINPYVLKELFGPVFYDSSSQSAINNLTLSKIISYVLWRINSYCPHLKSLLEQKGANFNALYPSIESISDNYDDYYALKEEKLAEKFYMSLDNKTREFLTLATKTSSYLSSNFSDMAENNRDTLSLVIAAFYFNTNITVLLRQRRINLESIYSFLGVENIPYEDLDKAFFDKKELFRKYKRYVKEGSNKGQDTNWVTPNGVCDNLCDSTFTNSTIIEEVEKHTTNSSSLCGNVHEQMKLALFKQEEQEEHDEYQAKSLFDKSAHDSLVFVKAINVFDYLKKSKIEGLTDNELVDLSMLISFYLIDECHFLQANGILLEDICKIYDINLSSLENRYPYFKSYLELFKKYIEPSNNPDEDSLKRIREKLVENNAPLTHIIDSINESGLGRVDFEQLKAEFVSNKTYISILPISERIAMLDEMAPVSLDENSPMHKYSTYSSCLSKHAVSIGEELSELLKEDAYQSSYKVLLEFCSKVQKDQEDITPEKLRAILARFDGLTRRYGTILEQEQEKYHLLKAYFEKYDEICHEYRSKINETACRLRSILSSPGTHDKYDSLELGIRIKSATSISDFLTTSISSSRQYRQMLDIKMSEYDSMIRTLSLTTELLAQISTQMIMRKNAESVFMDYKILINYFSASITGDSKGKEKYQKLLEKPKKLKNKSESDDGQPAKPATKRIIPRFLQRKESV